MFGCKRDQAFAVAGFHHTAQRKGVGLRRAAGKKYIVCVSANQLGHLAARHIDGGLALPAVAMGAAVRIAKLARQIWHHGSQRFWRQRRCRLIIKVDGRGH
jgi:hypothetical protein